LAPSRCTPQPPIRGENAPVTPFAQINPICTPRLVIAEARQPRQTADQRALPLDNVYHLM
jgi:hypothetical protein